MFARTLSYGRQGTQPTAATDLWLNNSFRSSNAESSGAGAEYSLLEREVCFSSISVQQQWRCGGFLGNGRAVIF